MGAFKFAERTPRPAWSANGRVSLLGPVTGLEPKGLEKQEEEIGLLCEELHRHVPADGPEAAGCLEGKNQSVGNWPHARMVRARELCTHGNLRVNRRTALRIALEDLDSKGHLRSEHGEHVGTMPGHPPLQVPSSAAFQHAKTKMRSVP